MIMKIVILQGSPNKNGSTNILAEEFTRGAEEAVQIEKENLLYLRH